MRIKGFQGTSLLDFPGRVASLIFFGGCNLTCPFCHNPSLVLDPDQYPDYPRSEILEELQNRIPFIDGVVISGGEPTLDPECINLLREIKSLGLAVKLDTNGLKPDVLKRLIDQELIDYLAFDLKTAPGRYGELHNAPVDLEALLRSIRLTLEGKVDYEFRSTCVPGFVTEKDVVLMGKTIKGAKRWVFQQFMPEHSLDEGLQGVESYPDEVIRGYAELGGGTLRRFRFEEFDSPQPQSQILTYPQSLLAVTMSARSNKRTQTAKTTTTNRNRLKSISHRPPFNRNKTNRTKKPTASEPFLWFVSLWLNKEMNPAVGPEPDGFE